MSHTIWTTDRGALAHPLMGVSTAIALNLTEAAASVGLDYDTALKHRLFERWEEAGLIWTVPGTQIRRVLVDALRQWVYDNQEEARPGTLASQMADFFRGHELEKHSRRAV